MNKHKIASIIAHGGLLLILLAWVIAFLMVPVGSTVSEVLEDDCTNKINAVFLLFTGICAIWIAYKIKHNK